MIIGLQLIAVIFALLMIYFALVNYKRKEINKTEMFIWSSIWIVVIMIVIFPEVLRQFSSAFLITRLFDLLIVGGFILIIAMTAKTYVTTRKLEKKLEDFVRKEALKDVKKKKK